MDDIIGGCERIFRTPLPLSYTRHSARFLALWLAFLPFTLWEKLHW
jgi:predicted membrane chloride channel (bestrophin family)